METPVDRRQILALEPNTTREMPGLATLTWPSMVHPEFGPAEAGD